MFDEAASKHKTRYDHMSYGRNYLFGQNAITQCGGSPIVLQVLNMDYGVSVHPLIL